MQSAFKCALGGFVLLASAVQAQAVTVNVTNSSTNGAGNQAHIFAPTYDGTTPAGASWSSTAPLVLPPPANEGGVYQSPFNNTVLGNSTTSGDDATPDNTYFSVGATSGGEGGTSPQTLTLASAVSEFTLLWGSIDSYNTISLLDGMGSVFFSYTGTQLINGAMIGTGSAPNFEEVALVTFVTDMMDSLIYGVKFESSQAALEFGLNRSAGQVVAPIPLPAGLLLLLSGLLGLGFLGRLKSKVLAD